jgi:pilus assembly protein Flp/PilA
LFFRRKEKVMLSRFVKPVVDFLKTEDGPTAVEYAVMLALIIVVCLVAITALGTSANKTFGDVASAIGAS